MINNEKIAVIGNMLITDIMLANLNNMVGIWVHRHTDYFKDPMFYTDYQTELDKMMALEANYSADMMKEEIKSKFSEGIS